MQTITYYRTWRDGQQFTHLSSNRDFAICGMDLIGDETVHDRPPMELEGTNHRVTCDDCQQVIATVRAHLTRRGADLSNAQAFCPPS